HAEEREIKQLEDLDARYVNLVEGSINDTGIADLMARGDWKDLHDLDRTLSSIAACLKEQGCTESLDVRRSMALGILADPEQAHAMLTGADAPAPARKQIVLHLHLSEAALGGNEVIGRNTATGNPMLAEQIREWCSRTDTHVTIKPVRDLNDAAGSHVAAYEIPDRLRETVTLLHPTCVYPWCTTPSSRCDLDHIVAYDRGGATSTENLAPLCRHHHRLKTHTGWTYRSLDPDDPFIAPGAYLWTDPYGNSYLRTRTGTQIVATAAADDPAA
ncbi:MAG: HNH endonuclease signature motif containing protein, partial [Nocardioides sp.]